MKNLHSMLLALSVFILLGGFSLAGTSLYRCLDQFGHKVYTDSPTQLAQCGKFIVKDQEHTDARQKNASSRGDIIVAQMETSPPPSADPLLEGSAFPEEEFPAPSPENTLSESIPYGGPDSVPPPSPGFDDGLSPMMPESPEGAPHSPEDSFPLPGGPDSGMHPE